MGSKSRRLFIWVVSLAAVFAVYMIYGGLNKTPKIEIDRGRQSCDIKIDSNSPVGKVGDVGIGTVEVAEFIVLNKNKQVDRKLGFKRLLHEMGNEWEIEKPYMYIFRRDFRCDITAETGKVQVEIAAGKPSPKDATLSGNVVIHILPEGESGVKESFVYLDDLVFISEKSQISTAGPVKFVSDDAQMSGVGMELVYNEERDRLEFLRIICLDSLRLKIPQAALLSSDKSDVGSPADSNGVQAVTQTEVQTQTHAQPEPTVAAAAPAAKDEYYRCVLSKDVVINSPKQLIFADEVSINNIFKTKKSNKESKTVQAGVSGKDVSSNNAGSEQKKPDQIAETVITCNGGIVITPMDFPDAAKNPINIRPKYPLVTKVNRKYESDDGKTKFVAQKIDYEYGKSAGGVQAEGPLELTFYVNDVMGAESNNQPSVPVKITAQKKADFSPRLNQVIFEGDCKSTMVRKDSGIEQKYVISGPKLTADLTRKNTNQSSDLVSGIKRLIVEGGTVRLSTIKTAGEKLLGGIELKCVKFDYDANQPLFLATGPGVMKVDNSNTSQPVQGGRAVDLRRRCYALVEDFETLEYFLKSDKFVADAPQKNKVSIGYVPVTDGGYGQQVKATASHIEALFYKTADGQNELSTMTASGGITYDEKDIQFAGSKLFYDAGKAMMNVEGDQFQACRFNGAITDKIEYDLKTGTVKAEITGPGVMQLKEGPKKKK